MKVVEEYFFRIRRWAVAIPGHWDLVFLVLGLVAVTFQPFYLYGRMNLLEAGFYLPGIDAILKGQVPYRDFIHLRGPLEIYLQALWMRFAGESYFVLPTYFYVGGILTMAIFVLIAGELLKTRAFLYLMSLAFIARTFPRVSLTIGGGFRHVWGALAVYWMVRYFKRGGDLPIALAGLCSALALATSVEIGVFSFVGILTVLFLGAQLSRKKFTLRPFVLFTVGSLTVLMPLAVFLQCQQALVPLLQTHYQVLANMVNTFPQFDPVPRNVLGFILSLLNPVNINFKHMTPLYCYVGGLVYLFILLRKGENCLGAIGLGVYGSLLFIVSMRGLWGPGFENAIQPEKVLLFVLLERAWFFLKDRGSGHWAKAAAVLLLAIFLSTTIYSISRFQKRFVSFKIAFLKNEKKRASIFPFSERNLVLLNSPRTARMVVPQNQAQDVQMLERFFKIHSDPKDKVLFFPDIGAYNFILDRPFVGRFPIVALSWISKGWHEEFMRAMDSERPRYIVMYKELPRYLSETQLIVPDNDRKYKEVLMYIRQHYHIVSTTPSFNISAENK